jgi:hypothetical protein
VTDAFVDDAPMVQLLTPEGDRVPHPDYDVDFSDDEYRELYRDLVLVRRVDVEATALQRQGELGLWTSLLGQEAAQVGSGRAMRENDYAFPSYREHGVAWVRGVDPVDIIAIFRGAHWGAWDPQASRSCSWTGTESSAAGVSWRHRGCAASPDRKGTICSPSPESQNCPAPFSTLRARLHRSRCSPAGGRCPGRPTAGTCCCPTEGLCASTTARPTRARRFLARI